MRDSKLAFQLIFIALAGVALGWILHHAIYTPDYLECLLTPKTEQTCECFYDKVIAKYKTHALILHSGTCQVSCPDPRDGFEKGMKQNGYKMPPKPWKHPIPELEK